MRGDNRLEDDFQRLSGTSLLYLMALSMTTLGPSWMPCNTLSVYPVNEKKVEHVMLMKYYLMKESVLPIKLHLGYEITMTISNG